MTSIAGRYRILDRLGEGGMSVVWRAYDEVLKRVVAIKVLAPDQIVDAAAQSRIQAEAQAAAALSHPNVAAVHDYGEAPGAFGEPVPYVVMELVDGPSLTDVLADGPVDPADAMRLCADVASGLAAVHDRGLVHRDVKPANVIVTAGGAKLVDFGIAAEIGAPDKADENGAMLGTPAYLAPERLVDGVVVPGSDVYALGLLLYRLLAGHLPWSSETTTQMLVAHAYLPPRELPAIEGVPAEVVDICHRCLAKDPADRPSAAAVAAALTGAAGMAMSPRPAVPDARTAGVTEPDAEPRGRRLRRLAVLAAVAVLVASLVLLFGRPTGQRDSADRPGGVGGIPALDGPSFPESGGAATVPGGGAAATGPGDPQPGTGAGTGIGVPSVPGVPGVPGVPPAGGGGGPTAGGGNTPPGNPGPTAPADPARRTANAPGGSAVVECTGAVAQLITWTAADGFEIQAVQPGPAASVTVRFRAGNMQSSILARCIDGVPDITVR